MIVFIFINSVILFILMQILGVPLSNLAVIDFKYDTFTFSKDKSTSGMNIIYNMLLANIYMLFIYELVEDNQIKNLVYFIVIGYLIIRYAYILLVLNRLKLLNLKYECTLIILTLFFTYLIQKNIITENISMKIPIEEFKNEILLLGILFLFSVFKGVLLENFSNRNNTSDRTAYIRYFYLKFLDKYDGIIDTQIEKSGYFTDTIENEKQEFKLLVYSFIIFENFSRPRFYRIIENVLSKISKNEVSTGIMQIRSKKALSDKESVLLGVDILVNSFYNHYLQDPNSRWDWIDRICDDYNPQVGSDYIIEINYILDELKKVTLFN